MTLLEKINMDLERLQQLKTDLFEIIQYCHDNEKDFLDRFVDIKADEIYSLNAIYMSGSSAVIMISHWHHDELYDKTVPVVTQRVLEWFVEHESNN